MENIKRYKGLIIFLGSILICVFLVLNFVLPNFQKLANADSELAQKQSQLEDKEAKRTTVLNKIKKLQDSASKAQKKIYSPIESDLGNDTLFFTLYNDVIEMVHSNSIRIKALDYEYNPKRDAFVESGKDAYFVCDVNMQLVSNYVNLGKLIQDLYQYPYYIKINEVNVRPYAKDKKLLITNMSLRLYAHTTPVEETVDSPMPKLGTEE